MEKDPVHDRLLEIVTKLPGAYEDRPWGSVHCKVDGKIFVGWARTKDGAMSVGFRVSLDDQMHLVETDPRFSIAAYVGRYGGVDMRLDPRPDWTEVERYIIGSYRIIAPKKRVKELDAMAGRSGGGSGSPAKPPAVAAKKAPAVVGRAKPARAAPASAKKKAAKVSATKKPASTSRAKSRGR